MSTAPLPAHRSTRAGARVLLVAIVAAMASLAVAGAVIGIGVVRQGAPPAGVPEAQLPGGPFGTAQDVPTSFGAVAVENVEKVKGLTGKDMAGMTHGVQSLVKAGKMQVNASITMTNLTDVPVAYSPTQWQLLVGKKKTPVDEVRASIMPGTLQPDAAIDGRLSFVAPAKGEQLWIAFDDPGRAKPILIDLGRIGRQTPDSAFDHFHKKP